MTEFQKRAISLRFTLAGTAGAFTESGENTVDIDGLRVRVELTSTSSTSMDQANVEVWGLPPSITKKLTILQNGWTQGNYNQVQITAGDGETMSLIFTGQIFTGWSDHSDPPESMFTFSAYGGLASSYASVPPLSYKGAVSAATIARSIAQQMMPPLTLHNSGVATVLTDPYLPGDATQQLRRLARMADFEYAMDEPGVLAIWPRGYGRDTQGVDVNEDTGLMGWPSFNDKGVIFSTLFNPSLRVNGPVNVDSLEEPANGTWYPYNVTHDLESEVSGGRWFSHCECQRFTGMGDQTVSG